MGRRAQAGDAEYQDYYFIFPDRTMPDAYERHPARDIPRPAAWQLHLSPRRGWVWTTFNSFQWDLNYSNPAVFNSMAEEMLFLANQGAEVLRLDALAFIWKQLGTSCENLPEAHMLVQAFNSMARIAAPSLLFKSEAIVHPDEVVKYIGEDECQLSYNPLLMALEWEALATRGVRLLRESMAHRFKLDPCCAWVNYVRSHDDIGWTFDDADAGRLGIERLRPPAVPQRLLHGPLRGQLRPRAAVPGEPPHRRRPHLGHHRFPGRAGASPLHGRYLGDRSRRQAHIAAL